MAERIIDLPTEKMATDLRFWLRERIVRCRDCRYYEPNTYSRFTCELLTFHVDPNDFCSQGERKEVDA